MSNLRQRPKGDYLQTAGWNEVYLLTKNWQSELNFFADEITFLNNLIGKYFIWMTKEKHLPKVQAMVKNLGKLNKKRETLEVFIKKHLSKINALMGNAPYNDDEPEFRKEHIILEDNITEFANEVRKVKREIFSITEHVMESQKLQHLLALPDNSA